VVVDFKGVETIAKAPRKPYPEQGMQLAAYAEGAMPGSSIYLGKKHIKPVRLVNLYFSRTEDMVDLREWSPEDAERSWKKFRCLLEFWQLSKDYDSSFEGKS
jgi:hypothetical protein